MEREMQLRQMTQKAVERYGDKSQQYFYVLEDELELYEDMEEIMTYKGMKLKLSSMRPVKVYNPTTQKFR